MIRFCKIFKIKKRAKIEKSIMPILKKGKNLRARIKAGSVILKIKLTKGLE